MTLTTVLIVLALVGATTVVGLLWRRSQGTAVRTVDARQGPGGRSTSPSVPSIDLGNDTVSGGTAGLAESDFGTDITFGEHATLLQFSTEFCSTCPATRRRLGLLAEQYDDVHHVDVDLTHRGDLANRFRILQTPTTFILDRHGRITARIGGAPRPGAVEAELAALHSTRSVRSDH
ncbi:TlpA family protein disulfide reductase [Subtercola frigoramans]|uniref:Thiol-disulfide isomerase/thioredoxin n=1 Tax=Subtercola frigoramans TaxID=120298 RepID=A0ABS2L4K4_9MICO|nr:thioredoxin family protein [Subtercola frigoramans]MBM7472032.1 thiol-disulfide isomerase/thioredoxin [Subtercola frigoramans]